MEACGLNHPGIDESGYVSCCVLSAAAVGASRLERRLRVGSEFFDDVVIEKVVRLIRGFLNLLFPVHHNASDRTNSRDAIERDKERVPHASLFRQNLLTHLGQPVVATASEVRVFDPSSFDEALILESI
jgi:hypothetical protein